LYSNSTDIKLRINELINQMQSNNIIDEYKHIITTYIRTKLRSKPLFGLLGYRIWKIYGKSIEFVEQSPIILGKMYKTDIATTIDRLKSLNKNIELQRLIANYYSKHLAINKEWLCYEKPEHYYIDYFILLKCLQ